MVARNFRRSIRDIGIGWYVACSGRHPALPKPDRAPDGQSLGQGDRLLDLVAPDFADCRVHRLAQGARGPRGSRTICQRVELAGARLPSPSQRQVITARLGANDLAGTAPSLEAHAPGQVGRRA
jgi:hypothetical protein